MWATSRPMRALRGSLIALASLLLMLVCVQRATAQDPGAQLQESIDRVLAILDEPALQGAQGAAERRRRIGHVAEQIFDFDEMARRALAKHWQPLGRQEREEFVQLFRELIEQSYLSKIELYRGEPIRYTGTTRDDEFATVSTLVVTPKGTQVPVDYRMRRRGERWYVYDVRIEGVSLVSNYRSQFNTVIVTSSYGNLVQRMRDRIEELREES